MELINGWSCISGISSRRRHSQTADGSGSYERIIYPSFSTSSSSPSPAVAMPGQKWKSLWRRILKEKKKLFGSTCSPSSPPGNNIFSYNAVGYSQNFDQGYVMIWSDPDGESRSFSARFAAVPTTATTSGFFDEGSSQLV
ncbi:unnamed protein product [Linum trigynum]